MTKSSIIDLLVCHSERSYVPLFVIQSVAMNHIPYTNVWGGAPIFIGVIPLRFILDDNSFFFCHSERSDESHSRTKPNGDEPRYLSGSLRFAPFWMTTLFFYYSNYEFHRSH